jgi:hypothetical protein
MIQLLQLFYSINNTVHSLLYLLSSSPVVKLNILYIIATEGFPYKPYLNFNLKKLLKLINYFVKDTASLIPVQNSIVVCGARQ